MSQRAALGAAAWLRLAAAPTFAMMALLSLAYADGHLAMVCTQSEQIPFLGGMVPMYLLMSVFHSAPWLSLASKRR